MLETSHLKSQFYIDHTFYLSPVPKEVNTPTKDSSPKPTCSKIPKLASLRSPNSKNLLEDSTPNTHKLRQSLNYPLRNTINQNPKAATRPKILDFNPNASKAQSVNGIKIKRLKHSEKFKLKSSRAQTPFFQHKSPETDELKDLYQRLAGGQEKLDKQQTLLSKLEFTENSHPKNQSNFPKIFRFDPTLIPSTTKNRQISEARATKSPFDHRIHTSMLSPSLPTDDLSSATKNISRSSVRSSPKYYKDQPKIKASMLFPKEVFTPKHVIN